MKRLILRLLRRQSGILVMVVIILSTSVIALGSHLFSDVPTAAFYHNAVEWISNRGITAGCGGSLYCPDAPVTRGQMAVFLQKEGAALTPDGRVSVGGGAPLTSATTFVCKTDGPAGSGSDPFTAIFSRQAAIFINLSLQAPAASTVTFGVQGAFSTDNGATWTDAPVGSSQIATAANSTWSSVSSFGLVSLNDTAPPTTYLFTAHVSWLGPGFSATDYRCSVAVLIINRNPTTSPL